MFCFKVRLRSYEILNFRKWFMYGLKAQKPLAQGSGRKQHALKGVWGETSVTKTKIHDFRLFQVDSDKLLHLSDGSDNLMHG